ncbi:hypothetical protein SLS62_002278 [Diatrype stigma]|uniref:Uncharacterized protein n=1 Tax=Diatrype stigma TaxID=117547 RepID=A0AAN9UYI8_9PEZI
MYSSPILRMMPSARMMRIVVGFAVFAAGYSCLRKFTVDKNLRLARQNRGTAEHGDEAEHH